MKSYKIGREGTCDIVINDPTNVVSRQHATLNVQDNGKMTIVDHSSNGTYINGIRISQNTSVPVTRKDTVSFAKTANLDWEVVKNPAKNRLTVIASLLVIILVGGGLYFYFSNNPINPNDNIVTVTENTDSIFQLAKDSVNSFNITIKKLEKRFENCQTQYDSLLKVVTHKQECKKLEEAKKILYQVEPQITQINLENLRREVNRLDDNASSKNDDIVNELLKEIPVTLQGYKQKVSKIEEQLDKAYQLLSEVKDKSMSAKETGKAKDKDKEPINPFM